MQDPGDSRQTCYFPTYLVHPCYRTMWLGIAKYPRSRRRRTVTRDHEPGTLTAPLDPMGRCGWAPPPGKREIWLLNNLGNFPPRALAMRMGECPDEHSSDYFCRRLSTLLPSEVSDAIYHRALSRNGSEMIRASYQRRDPGWPCRDHPSSSALNPPPQGPGAYWSWSTSDGRPDTMDSQASQSIVFHMPSIEIRSHQSPTPPSARSRAPMRTPTY